MNAQGNSRVTICAVAWDVKYFNEINMKVVI